MKVKSVINFFFNCGKDNKCQSELEASYTLEGLMEHQTFIVGSKENPVLSIYVSNAGEPSYNTEVNVTIPDPLELIWDPQHCRKERNARILLCDVGNPLTDGKPALIKLHLIMSEVIWKPEPLVFNFSLLYSNRSENLNSRHEAQHMKLHLKSDACIGLVGKSRESFSSNSTNTSISFGHEYEVYKYGVSPVQDIDLFLSIPISWMETKGNLIQFLDFETEVRMQNGIPPQCYLNGTLLEQSAEETEKEQPDYNDNNEEELLIRRKREVIGNKTQDDHYSMLYANRTLILNCSTPNIVCYTVHCKISAFPNGRQDAAQVLLKMKLNVDKLGVVLNKKDIISISTNASVKYRKQNADVCADHPIFVQSAFPLSIKKAALSTWVICLSIIAGVLIFMLLSIGLIKAGFFRREKKEKLLEMKRRSAMPSIMSIPGEVLYTEDAEFMEVEGSEQ